MKIGTFLLVTIGTGGRMVVHCYIYAPDQTSNLSGEFPDPDFFDCLVSGGGRSVGPTLPTPTIGRHVCHTRSGRYNYTSQWPLHPTGGQAFSARSLPSRRRHEPRWATA